MAGFDDMETQNSSRSKMLDRLPERSIQILFLLIAPVGVVASKGIVLLIILSGIVGLISWFIKGCPGVNLPKPPIILLSLTLVWAGISSVWALDSMGAAILTARLIVICICGLATLYSLKELLPVSQRRLKNYLLVGYGLGAVALGIGYLYARSTGTSLWSSFSDDPLTTLNNGAVIMALLFLPFATILWNRGHKVGALAVCITMLAGLFFLSSDASILSLLVGIFACVFTILLGRRGALIIMVVIVTGFLAAPILTSTLLKPNSIHSPGKASISSTEHRKKIWQFVNERIDEKPFLGWGMDSSRDIPKGTSRLSKILEILPLHPHSLALQIRLELGLPGAILVAAFITTLFLSLFPPGLRVTTSAVAAGVISSYLLVGSISYGVWQNWWVALAWCLCVITYLVSYPNDSGCDEAGDIQNSGTE